MLSAKSSVYITLVRRDSIAEYPILFSRIYPNACVPPVGFNMRAAKISTTLPRGGGHLVTEPIDVFAGQQILYSLINLQRRRDIFGIDAETFRPDRWINWRPGQWEYLPFSYSPRMCPGMGFSTLLIEYTIVRLFQTFAAVEGDWGGAANQGGAQY